MRKISIKTLKYLILLLGSVVFFFPLYNMFIGAISGWGPRFWLPFNLWLPLKPTLENFIYAWNYVQDPPLWRAFLNSTIVAVPRTLLVLFASSLTACALAVYKFRGRHAIFWIVIFHMFIPSFLGLIPSYMLMKWLGWLNTYWALIIPSFVNAYSVFLIRQYIITIPDDILDAARLSGCSEFGLFWRIVLPISKPALAAVGLLNFVWSWNDFLWPTFILTNRNMFTVQVALSWVTPSGRVGMALLTLATLPLITFTIFTQKYLMKGFAGLGYMKR